MLLNKLEIKGFKSFGDRVVINFDEGITGIVGPNGCGKSNVVDAIRWALGEQKTRTLRSDKMENVIFNGAKSRKATQMAEVSLTFSNTKNLLPTEYSEVTITRKYYRSGDSEYLLNGVPCRLKDITNLFLDTGIASNSYAIIELKMVDDLLNDKDNSRRALFEEAAGISKFKLRKKETIRKLEDTDADLDRVEDLLFEIDKNMKSLERQARQAKKYYKTKEEYKELSVRLATKTVKDHNDSVKSLDEQIRRETDRKLALTAQMDEKEAGIEKLKTEILNKEKILSSRQKALNEHVTRIRQYESDKKIKNERLRYLNDKSESLKEQLEQDKKSNERAAFSIQSLNQEKDSAARMLRETEEKVRRLQEEYEEQKHRTTQIQEELNLLNQTLRQKQEEFYRINKECEIKEIQLSTIRQELEKTTSDTSAQSASLEEFRTKIKAISENLTVKKSSLEKLKKEEEDIQTRLESANRTIELIRDEHAQLNRKLDARQNEYNLTKSLVDNLEGFPEAIRFLRKHNAWYKNAPLLSDIIACPEEYRVAIENYLEPYMNYYVVENEAQAYQAVNLLSDASKGKAHFFILDAFDKFASSPGRILDNAVPATEIIEFDHKYRKLVGYLLDNVFIVKKTEDMPADNHESAFITLNGKMIRRKFSLSGGSVGLFEGKRIGRAKNLEKLQAEMKTLSSRLDEAKENLEAEQKTAESLKNSLKKEEIENLQEKIREINEEYISLKTRLEQFEQMLDSNAMKKEDMQEKIAELTESLAQLRPQVEKENQALDELRLKIGGLNEEAASQNELLSVRSSAYNQENLIYHQQQNKVSSIEQEIGFKQSAFESSSERIEKNKEALSRNEEEIKTLLATSEDNEEELIEMYREKDAIESAVNEAEKDYYQTRGDADQREKELKELTRNRQSVDELLSELQNKLNELKLQLNSVKERLAVEFNIELEEALSKTDTEEIEETEEALRQKVAQIRDQLERMGPINPMAMEAYEEIKERFDFISSQKEDLLKAKESLILTINEIDQVAKDAFLDSFQKIKENFIMVFRSLFTEEDDCDLRLTNPDDPLESSIEIIAKPKGKRPLSINQLSGGEKTLTATSLLFSIYLLKPAPFCIFDEVDAPLDDANIDKFNQIIKKFSRESQFIIVTHNKRTMASTDVIYGITMVEQGVSRVVPVDLRELAD